MAFTVTMSLINTYQKKKKTPVSRHGFCCTCSVYTYHKQPVDIRSNYVCIDKVLHLDSHYRHHVDGMSWNAMRWSDIDRSHPRNVIFLCFVILCYILIPSPLSVCVSYFLCIFSTRCFHLNRELAIARLVAESTFKKVSRLGQYIECFLVFFFSKLSC